MSTSREEIRLIGFRWSPETHEIKDFLARNQVTYHWLDPDTDPEARALLEDPELAGTSLPLLLFPDGSRLVAPSDAEVAEKIGLSTEATSPFYDTIIVGGGPAGLAAAVYAGSEGLRTLIVERDAPGGQAGYSARIENCLGFPDGIGGGELARRAVKQAERFGVEILAARTVTGIAAEGRYRFLTLDEEGNTRELACHTILLATGISWRLLEAPGCSDLLGAGVYYGAASSEAAALENQNVFIAGGGEFGRTGRSGARAPRPLGHPRDAGRIAFGADVPLSCRSNRTDPEHQDAARVLRDRRGGKHEPGDTHDPGPHLERGGDRGGERSSY